jgi:hypothetical protein
MKTTTEILKKWEERIASILAEDIATVDMGDYQMACAVKSLIEEIREVLLDINPDDIDIFEQYTRTDGHRDWAKHASTWLYQGDMICIISDKTAEAIKEAVLKRREELSKGKTYQIVKEAIEQGPPPSIFPHPGWGTSDSTGHGQPK